MSPLLNITKEGVREGVRDLLYSRSWRDRPQMISFEITAACDAKCIHCPRLDMDRPMKAMSMEIFHRMVDQASDLGVPYLCPNGYGEICTLPVRTLREYLEYISSKKHAFKIVVNTNGNLMNEERRRLFIEHRVHLVNVTIDGATAETAESIRVNLDFNRIEANIKALIAQRDAAGLTRPKVRVSMVSMPQTIPEMPQFFERWRGIADFVGIGGFSSRLASVWGSVEGTSGAPADGRETEPRASACVLPFKDLNIWSNGLAVLCCEDWNEEFVVGDLNTQTIDEIWHGEPMTDVRRRHMARTGGSVALCAKCNHWEKPSWGARLWA